MNLLQFFRICLFYIFYLLYVSFTRMNIIQDEEPTSDSKERDNVSNGTKVLTYIPCFLSTVVKLLLH